MAYILHFWRKFYLSVRKRETHTYIYIHREGEQQREQKSPICWFTPIPGVTEARDQPSAWDTHSGAWAQVPELPLQPPKACVSRKLTLQCSQHLKLGSPIWVQDIPLHIVFLFAIEYPESIQLSAFSTSFLFTCRPVHIIITENLYVETKMTIVLRERLEVVVSFTSLSILQLACFQLHTSLSPAFSLIPKHHTDKP